MKPEDETPEAPSTERPEAEIPPSQPEHLNVIQRTIGVFSAPQQTFEDIAARPNWVFPLVLAIFVTMVLTQFLVPAILSDVRTSPQYEQLMGNEELTPEQLENIQRVQERSIQNFSALGAGATVAVASLIAAAIFLFVGNIIFGGNANYNQVFSVYCWSGLIGVLGYLIRFPISLSQTTMKIYFSPAYFLTGQAENSALFKIAGALDIFVVWKMILLGIGLAAIYRFTLGKSLGIVFGLFVLQIAFSVALAGLF